LHHKRSWESTTGPESLAAMAGMVKAQADDDEKLDDKEELSPWAVPNLQDPSTRIVGWRNGVALKQSEVDTIIRKEKPARQELKRLRKQISKHRSKEQADPTKDLPPTWKAFWSTVPHLNPKAAYEEYLHREAKAAKAKRNAEKAAEAALDAEGHERETIDEEIIRLEQRVKQVKEALGEKDKLIQEWSSKLERVRKLDEDADDRSRRVRRKLEVASYNHGVVQGKLRSSDTYHTFLYQGEQQQAKNKVVTLSRSCALMDKQMDLLKGHVRLLLKDAATLERESSVAADGLTDGKSSDRGTVRSSRSLKDKLKAPPQSPSLHH